MLNRKICRALSCCNRAAKAPAADIRTGEAAFCPRFIKGCRFATGGDPVLYLSNPQGVDPQLQRDTLDSVKRLNEMHLAASGRSGNRHAHQFVRNGLPHANQRAGVDGFFARIGRTRWRCTARSRASHRSPTTVCWPGGWSSAACVSSNCFTNRGISTATLKKDLKKNCADTDQACAALVKDLKQRGMLDDTIVIWGGEFGRTPMVQGEGGDGRDHHPNCFQHVAGRRRLQAGADAGLDRRFRFQRRDRCGTRPRFARYDFAPAGLRSHAADVSFPRPRLSADRRARKDCGETSGLI